MAKASDKDKKKKIDVTAIKVPSRDGTAEVGEAFDAITEQIEKNAATWTGTQEEFDAWQRAHLGLMLFQMSEAVNPG